MVLVNGAEGIGTGWSTSVPCYSPIDIINNLKLKLSNSANKFKRMYPWYNGFRGTIVPSEPGKFTVSGRFERLSEDKLLISELPLKKWTRDYKNFLEELAQNDQIKDIKEFHKDNKIEFRIKFNGTIRSFASSDEELEKKLKLSSSMSCNNFVLFNKNY